MGVVVVAAVLPARHPCFGSQATFSYCIWIYRNIGAVPEACGEAARKWRHKYSTRLHAFTIPRAR